MYIRTYCRIVKVTKNIIQTLLARAVIRMSAIKWMDTTCKQIHTYIYTYVCIHIRMYVRKCVHTYVCTLCWLCSEIKRNGRCESVNGTLTCVLRMHSTHSPTPSSASPFSATTRLAFSRAPGHVSASSRWTAVPSSSPAPLHSAAQEEGHGLSQSTLGQDKR